MTSLQEYLIAPENCATSEKEFTLPRLKGQKLVLKGLTNEEQKQAKKKATKIVNGIPDFDELKMQIELCLMGITNLNFRDQEWIDAKNAQISKYNAKLVDASKDGNVKPTLQKSVQTAEEMVEATFNPGEITEIAEKILELSGYGVKLQEYVDKAKN